jgi:hypothetical protein
MTDVNLWAPMQQLPFGIPVEARNDELFDKNASINMITKQTAIVAVSQCVLEPIVRTIQ